MEGSPSFRFGQKLKLLKICLVNWRKEFGGLEKTKLDCLCKMEELKMKGMNLGLTEEDKGALKELERDYNSLLKMEEIAWRQRSRIT